VGHVENGARDPVPDERPDDEHRTRGGDPGLDEATLPRPTAGEAAPRVGDPPHHLSPSTALADSTWTTWLVPPLTSSPRPGPVMASWLFMGTCADTSVPSPISGPRRIARRDRRTAATRPGTC